MNDIAALPPDGQPLLGVRVVDPGPASEFNGGRDAFGRGRLSAPLPVTGARSSSRPTCSGRVLWLVPEQGVRACVLLCGHDGDHRDAAGYPWNDERWLD